MSENKNFFRASAEDFKKIPGSPVAYWVSHQLFNLLSGQTFESKIEGRIGLATGNNERHLRLWFELPNSHIGYGYDRAGAKESGLRWFPINKAGEFRRWYGNVEYVVNWKDDGVELQTTLHPDGHRIWAHNFNLDYIFKPHIGWSNITSGTVSFRKYERGFLFDASANAAYADEGHYDYLLGISNTCFVKKISSILNPTIHFNPGDFHKIPYVEAEGRVCVERNVQACVGSAKRDWDAYETSWDFVNNPLVDLARGVNNSEPSNFLISNLYAHLRAKWAKDCEEMHRLEMENNRIFIEAYGLQGELTPEVPWQEITLTCNPFYRYGVKDVEKVSGCGGGAAGVCALPRVAELEERLKGDTVKELISYGVGCMMGRYSLAKPGLILADQGAQVSDRWIVVSGQRSGQGSVDSGQRSGQGGVDRVQCRDLLVLRETVVECVRKELQRIDCLAEGDGSRGRSVSTGEAASSGGAVCLVGSTATSGRIDSVEHRRGTGTEHDSRLSELSDNGSRVVLRDGNTVVDLCSPEVLDAIASGSGAELVRRGWKDAERVDWKAIHSSLATNHFSPDEDGIIPVLDDDCFADDIVTQFEKFLVAAFGAAQLGANRAFIEQALGKDLRSYFVKDFYADHLQRYQKRPIYWLFSSPKGTFNALVYLHRYQPNTAGQVLGYLRSFITKLQAKIEAADKTAADPSASQSFRTRAIKERTKLARQLKELEDYERDVLHPLSLQHVALDLDDGVKVNYLKLGAALKKIPGLEAKE